MTRIEQEKQTITVMIKIYCKKKHKHKNGLCPECEDLNAFAYKRLDHCRHGENKTFCGNCPTQCYAPKYKQKVKAVMRFSGPWMLLYHPVLAIRHLTETIKQKKKLKKQNNN